MRLQKGAARVNTALKTITIRDSMEHILPKPKAATRSFDAYSGDLPGRHFTRLAADGAGCRADGASREPNGRADAAVPS